MATSIDIKIRQDFLRLKTLAVPPETDEDGCLFLNELDGKPKFREPNHGLVYDLVLRRYIGKNCVYQQPDDTNGLFYWHNTDFGTKPWVNDYIQTINVYPTGGLSVPEYSDKLSLFNRQPSAFVVEETPFSSLVIDFSFSQKFYPTGIFLRSPSIDTFGFLQNYVVYMLEEGAENSICSFSFEDDLALLGVNSFHYIPVDNNNRAAFRVVVLQTGPNSIGTNHFALGQIELYGKFI